MSDLQQQQGDSLIFCDLTVFTQEERERHMQIAQDLLGKTLELRDLEDGYMLLLPDEDGIIMQIADFITDDRKCCAFIHFGMDIEPFGKGIWLLLKGGEDVKEAIRGEMLGMLPDGVANKV